MEIQGEILADLILINLFCFVQLESKKCLRYLRCHHLQFVCPKISLSNGNRQVDLVWNGSQQICQAAERFCYRLCVQKAAVVGDFKLQLRSWICQQTDGHANSLNGLMSGVSQAASKVMGKSLKRVVRNIHHGAKHLNIARNFAPELHSGGMAILVFRNSDLGLLDGAGRRAELVLAQSAHAWAAR